jgi:hypothetical protein
MLKPLLFFGAIWVMMAGRMDARPNFSGTWKLNPEKSQFGRLPAPTSRTDVIEHQDPSLKLHVTQANQKGEISYDLNYTTDGQENANDFQRNHLKSRLRWEGDHLLVDTNGTVMGARVTFKDKWTLLEDGKVLRVDRHMATPLGEGDQVMIFEKQ